MLDICFFNLNHIGDVYFMAYMINEICSLNEKNNFLYYSINGSIFFENIPNLKKIQEIDKSYSKQLNNGEPPENLINNEILQFLLNNNITRSGSKILNYKNNEILFINTWCISEYVWK